MSKTEDTSHAFEKFDVEEAALDTSAEHKPDPVRVPRSNY